MLVYTKEELLRRRKRRTKKKQQQEETTLAVKLTYENAWPEFSNMPCRPKSPKPRVMENKERHERLHYESWVMILEERKEREHEECYKESNKEDGTTEYHTNTTRAQGHKGTRAQQEQKETTWALQWIHITQRPPTSSWNPMTVK